MSERTPGRANEGAYPWASEWTIERRQAAFADIHPLAQGHTARRSVPDSTGAAVIVIPGTSLPRKCTSTGHGMWMRWRSCRESKTPRPGPDQTGAEWKKTKKTTGPRGGDQLRIGEEASWEQVFGVDVITMTSVTVFSPYRNMPYMRCIVKLSAALLLVCEKTNLGINGWPHPHGDNVEQVCGYLSPRMGTFFDG